MSAKYFSLNRATFFLIAVIYSVAAPATPKIQHWSLENGTKVYFVEAHEIPMLQLTAVFDAGAIRDDNSKSGVSMLTSAMLNEGAGELNDIEIAERFESIGAQFGSNSGREMTSVSLRCLSDTKQRRPALGLFAEILARPTFPAPNLERERRRALIGLQRVKQSPEDIAGKELMALLYPQHPYGVFPAGTEAGIAAITREDLIAFHKQFYVGKNAILAMVGDVKLGDAKAIAQAVMGRLPAGERAAPIAPPPELTRAQEKVLPYPAEQAHILVAAPGMARKDPDYFPLFVGNYVLGGSGLVSRLSEQIREKQGLSYSVYSYFNPFKERGPFVMGLQTKNSQRSRALQSLRAVLADFVRNGPTEAELNAAKKNLTGGFPLRIDSNGKIAEYLTVIGYYDLPLDYLDRFNAKVEAVTAEQVRDAFQRRIDPARMLTVIVGAGER